MNKYTNAYVVEKVMYGLYNTAGRRTSYNFAIAIMDTITRVLEQRYDFLKYLVFRTQNTSDGVIKIDSNINLVDPGKVGKAIETIVNIVCMDLHEKAGLFFISELKKNTDQDVFSYLNDYGVDLELLQIQQHYIYRQNKRIKTISKENLKELSEARQEKRFINYTWEDVSNCEYDPTNKTCTIYDKDGNILDFLNLNYMVRNYIEYLSEENGVGTTNNNLRRDKERNISKSL